MLETGRGIVASFLSSESSTGSASVAYWMGAGDDARRYHDGASRRLREQERAAQQEAANAVDPDRAIAEAIRSQDEIVARVAFETLFRTYYTPLVAFAAVYVRQPEIAEEVVCDVFAWLWPRRTQWNPGGSARSYLYAAVRNRAFNTNRSTRRGDARAMVAWRDTLHVDGDTTRPADQTIEQDEQSRAVAHAIQSLSERARAAIGLRYGSGLTAREIAHVLGVSVSAVEQELSRARRAIRAAVARYIE